MPAPDNYSLATLDQHIGHDFGMSDPITVDQPRIDTFADATGDYQWIHVDVEKAKLSPFGGTIAHGFLTLSLVAASLDASGIVPADAKAVLNYGIDKARFLAPVPAGAQVQSQYKLIGCEPKGAGNTLLRLEAVLHVVGQDKPAVVAELLAMIVS